MPNLLENRLLLQYLSAAGMDIMGGGTLGANVNAVTQQNISAQSYAKLLQQMLSGGGKITMDKDQFSIKGPVGALQGPQGPGTQSSLAVPQENIGLRGTSGTADVGSAVTPMKPGPTKGPEVDLLSMLLLGQANPSVSLPDVSGADLAGLTTQDISQALQFKFAQEGMERQKVSDVINNLYKISLIEQMGETTELGKAKEARQWVELLRTSPFAVPGLGRLSLDEWSKLDAKTKSYLYYAFDAGRRGEEVLSYQEWILASDPTSIEQIWKLAEEDPEFKDFFFESKKAGATRITLGEKVEEKKALSELQGQLYFKDPKWTTDLGKHLSSEDVSDKIFRSDDPGLTRAKEKVRFIEDKISAGGGTIEDVKLLDDGKTMIWTVVWPSGDTETIRHAVRD